MTDDRRPPTADRANSGRRSSVSGRKMKPILILGLGNPLQGDDGVGCRVVQALQARPLPNNVEVLDGGTPGIGLLNLIEGRARVIIVDAAEMGLAPGEFRRFTANQVTLTGAAQRLSLHRSGVADALALAQALNLQLPEIVFFGVQPASVEWRASLSPTVHDAVPRVIDAILDELSQSMKSEG
ncbi:MAG: hydrogenase maturation protease [Anaerolineae bacterium]|nr:hydrogenase maturation protease [Anaerolineae bacterium]